MAVHYEWVIEELDRPDGDDAEITDVNHAPTYREARAFLLKLKHGRIALVRDRNHFEIDTRSWAYVEDGALPEWMVDAFGRQDARVPKSYRQQFEKGDV